MRHALFVWLVISVVAAAAPPLSAQTQITTGVIQGTVTDSSGAVVPGVTVEAVNVETNLTQSRVTGDDGRFVMLQLPSGRYRVTRNSSCARPSVRSCARATCCSSSATSGQRAWRS